MNLSDRIKNIEEMERIFDKMHSIIQTLDKACQEWDETISDFKRLMDYYSSPEWHEDVKDSNENVFPQDLKCGVLSEDGIYNLYADHRNTALQVAKTAIKALE
ncbi:MAG: DUF4298 domain-containing protein [Bacteroidales bacterium]|jgi:hypothetical protein